MCRASAPELAFKYQDITTAAADLVLKLNRCASSATDLSSAAGASPPIGRRASPPTWCSSITNTTTALVDRTPIYTDLAITDLVHRALAAV